MAEERIIGRQYAIRQQRKPRADSFTAKKRQKFLDALAFTCNVRESARQARVDLSTPYKHRLRDPQFAEQWSEAIAMGYDRIEALVLEHGGAGQAMETADGERADAAPPFDFEKGLKVLQHYRRKREGEPVRHGGRQRQYATREQTNAALLKALDWVEARERQGKNDG